jgi:hypothetical protein
LQHGAKLLAAFVGQPAIRIATGGVVVLGYAVPE